MEDDMEQKFTQMAQEALSDAVQNAAALGNPGRLAVAMRWMLENSPDPVQLPEAKNVRGK